MQKKVLIPIITIFIFIPTISLFSIPVVKSQLTAGLIKIFPEIKKGYIDLNQNGKPDKNAELNEYIPDSIVKDNKLQGKEILNFIIKNYPYIPLDKLLAVQKLLKNSNEAIPELIALNFMGRMEETIAKKKELEAKGLYLTPSALREAYAKETKYINTMVQAYKKESQKLEKGFIEARDKLFTMIEQGYPLPDKLGEEDRDILVSIMINTIIKESKKNPSRVKVAIKTLGRLKAESAVNYLISIINQPDLRIESIRALGQIGSPKALKLLLAKLDTVTDKQSKLAIIEAIGNIGNKSSVGRLISILNPESGKKVDQDILITTLKALANIASISRGESDRALQNIFANYISSTDPQIRVVAVEGLSNFKNSITSDKLFSLLRKETVEQVRIAVIKAINKLQFPNTVPTLVAILRNKSTSKNERIAVINALGINPNGDKGLVYIIGDLASPDKDIRSAAKEALINLYAKHKKAVVGAISNSLRKFSKDEMPLEAATSVLARLADPDSMNYLIPLLSSQYPQVKKNVTWALYRIHSSSNPRAVDELKRLVKSDTETLSVRINAVRALGAIGLDSPQLKVWETLLDVVKIRNPKFAILRLYAIQSLGELKTTKKEVIDILRKIALRETNLALKRAAVSAIRNISIQDPNVESALVTVFKNTKDTELKVKVIEALGDMFSGKAVELAPDILNSEINPSTKERVIYALYQIGGTEELSLIIDSASDKRIRDFVEGVLENANPTVLQPLLDRRIKSETNQDILNMLEDLNTRLEESY